MLRDNNRSTITEKIDILLVSILFTLILLLIKEYCYHQIRRISCILSHFPEEMDGWMEEPKDGRTDGRKEGRMDGWMDAWMHGWMDGCMDGWMHGCMDR